MRPRWVKPGEIKLLAGKMAKNKVPHMLYLSTSPFLRNSNHISCTFCCYKAAIKSYRPVTVKPGWKSETAGSQGRSIKF
jgi:hypothetical protein